MNFSACRGQNFCTEGGTHCEGCGRSHEEIADTRRLIDEVVNFAQKMGYDNVEEFTEFVAVRSAKKFRFQEVQGGGAGVSIPLKP